MFCKIGFVVVVASLAGCANFVESLNKSHQDLMKKAEDSPLAIHEGDVKPVPAEAFKPQKADPQ